MASQMSRRGEFFSLLPPLAVALKVMFFRVILLMKDRQQALT